MASNIPVLLQHLYGILGSLGIIPLLYLIYTLHRNSILKCYKQLLSNDTGYNYLTIALFEKSKHRILFTTSHALWCKDYLNINLRTKPYYTSLPLLGKISLIEERMGKITNKRHLGTIAKNQAYNGKGLLIGDLEEFSDNITNPFVYKEIPLYQNYIKLKPSLTNILNKYEISSTNSESIDNFHYWWWSARLIDKKTYTNLKLNMCNKSFFRSILNKDIPIYSLEEISNILRNNKFEYLPEGLGNKPNNLQS